MGDIYWYPEPRPRGPSVQRDDDGKFAGLLIAPHEIVGPPLTPPVTKWDPPPRPPIGKRRR